MSNRRLHAGAGVALGLLILAARRPALACTLLALAIPLSAGMAGGAVVPLLLPLARGTSLEGEVTQPRSPGQIGDVTGMGAPEGGERGRQGRLLR